MVKCSLHSISRPHTSQQSFPNNKGLLAAYPEHDQHFLQSHPVPTPGQPCFWFSQGCFIGCAECTGTDIQPEGMNKSHEGNQCTLNNRSAGGTSQPTLPKRCWTMNRGAVEDSVNDTYRFHPWRAPGSAPVADSCGVAG